tara:strand:+ start:3001 stop:3279 length:279 start_codon:yes stop_codon:yes gene_type:complete
MSKKSSPTRFRVSSNCNHEVIGENLIILNRKTGNYHEMNQIGKEIWIFIEKNRPDLQEIITFMSKNYEEDSIREDIEEFINELIEKQILEYD